MKLVKKVGLPKLMEMLNISKKATFKNSHCGQKKNVVGIIEGNIH
jgi:hypothetical protein